MQQIAYQRVMKSMLFWGSIPPDPPKGFSRFRRSELQLPTGPLQNSWLLTACILREPALQYLFHPNVCNNAFTNLLDFSRSRDRPEPGLTLKVMYNFRFIRLPYVLMLYFVEYHSLVLPWSYLIYIKISFLNSLIINEENLKIINI